MESILANCTSGGCGAKIGPGELNSILNKIPQTSSENLIIGYNSCDDAAVYRLDDKRSMISTIDFFSPMVDDPYLFGQIAAANALSDVYAMGGKPELALNLICFPEKMDKAVLAEILKGGAEKVKEAGAAIGGGHSIYDKEIKYGLAVTGFADSDKILRNNTPKVGDKLILTKPLGVGIVMAARKVGQADAFAFDKAISAMTRLNRYAAEKLGDFETVSACTDITGFGFLAHLLELCSGDVSAEINIKNLPIIAQALDYAKEYILTGAGQRNRNYFGDNCDFGKAEDATQEILFDPQTSGGLLIAVSSVEAEKLLEAIKKDDSAAEVVGEITSPKNKKVILKG